MLPSTIYRSVFSYCSYYFIKKKMNDEQLIKLVREYSPLYDLTDPKYMDNSYKLDIWNNIGKKMEVNGSLCKSRWNNIRDNYRKSLKKYTTKCGQNAKKIKLYKYSQQLCFLKKYFDERETKGSIVNLQKNEDQHDRETQSDDEAKDEVHFDIEKPLEETVKDNLPRESSSKNTTEVPAKLLKPKSTTKITVPRQTAAAKLMEYFIARNESQIASTQHPVDAFLAGLAPTLKTFNPFYLNLAKSEIFSIVQRFDMKMLEQQHSYQRSVLNFNRNVTPQSDCSSTSSKCTPTQLLLSGETFHENQDQDQTSVPPITKNPL